MNLEDFFKIEDVEFTNEELELPYEDIMEEQSPKH